MFNQACHPQYRKILEDITVDCVLGCENDRLSDDSGLGDGIWLFSCPQGGLLEVPLTVSQCGVWERNCQEGSKMPIHFPKEILVSSLWAFLLASMSFCTVWRREQAGVPVFVPLWNPILGFLECPWKPLCSSSSELRHREPNFDLWFIYTYSGKSMHPARLPM